MASKIEYVDETWNPVTGCTKISPGCQNCYAERMARRLAGRFGYPEAPHHFDVTLHPNRLHEPQVRMKPTRYLTCSMGDLFHNDLSLAYVAHVWTVMAFTPRHTFLVLTKRPARMAKFIEGRPRMLPNVWLGVTVESQEEMWRVEELLKIPAALHWVSIEPMLGPIDIPADYFFEGGTDDAGRPAWYRDGIGWVVLGGETGPKARPMHPHWVRKVRDDCVAAGVDFFFKGWGAWAPAPDWNEQQQAPWLGKKSLWLDIHGNSNKGYSAMMHDPEKFCRVGKKAAGRLLDGREWNEMPED